MKHATVPVGSYTIPLIGVPASATDWRCDRCKKSVNITILKLDTMGRNFLCPDCIDLINGAKKWVRRKK